MNNRFILNNGKYGSQIVQTQSPKELWNKMNFDLIFAIVAIVAIIFVLNLCDISIDD